MAKLEYHCPEGKKKEVIADLKELKQQDKIKAAFLSWFALTFMACLSVFIPVAHFVLVPLFLGLSLYFAYSAYKNSLEIGEFVFECPSCKQEISSKKTKIKEHLKLHCPNCRHQIYLRAMG